jgi:hypothetical protein
LGLGIDAAYDGVVAGYGVGEFLDRCSHVDDFDLEPSLCEGFDCWFLD